MRPKIAQGKYGYIILVKLHRKEQKKAKSRSKKKLEPKMAWTRVNLVESRGIEPLSENNLEGTSPGAVCYLHSLIRAETNTLPDLVAS